MVAMGGWRGSGDLVSFPPANPLKTLASPPDALLVVSGWGTSSPGEGDMGSWSSGVPRPLVCLTEANRRNMSAMGRTWRLWLKKERATSDSVQSRETN